MSLFFRDFQAPHYVSEFNHLNSPPWPILCESRYTAGLYYLYPTQSFHWNVGGIAPPAAIFPVLQSSAPALECVKIHSFRPSGNNDVQDKWYLRDSPLWKLSNLTSFSFAVSCLTSFYNTKLYVPELLDMLARCPRLEELELLLACDLRATSLDALFQRRWPRLKSFLLGGPERTYAVSVSLDSSTTDVQAFFAAHSTLERLYLSIVAEPGVRDRPSFSIDCVLPNLKLLHVHRSIFTMIAPAVRMPHLKHLRGVVASTSSLPLFHELTLGAPHITSIWLTLHNSLTLPAFKSFLECLPQLEKLYISNGPPNPWVPIVTMPDAFYQAHRVQHRRPLPNGAQITHNHPRRLMNVQFGPHSNLPSWTINVPFTMSTPVVVIDDPLGDALNALRAVPRLTHLPNFVIFHAYGNESLDALVDPVVRRFAAELPRLAFLEVIITTLGLCPPTDTGDVLKEGRTWLAIQRDASNGVCIGWNVLADADRDGLELDYKSWGALKWLL
ncbi:hypothetical protein B0H19DRAFT_1380337 [Mycena capillaripes]|nr:hypothetical protein B0H19DRAFT_1380337 [Mycena capillaripes]